ncbi:MAG: hypothetical protein M3O46_22915 [Myxococcota bacterium]|nr:hypothetical protein [Myxococcota bacterium]
MPMRCRATVGWVVSAVLTLHSPLAGAQETTKGEADTDACFAAAERAQPLMKQKKLRQARAELETCARDVCPRIARTDCRGWLADVVSEQPSIVIVTHEVRGSEVHDLFGVRATIDGVIVVQNIEMAPVVVDPGAHRLHLEAVGVRPLDEDIDVREGEKRRIVHAYFQAPVTTAPPRENLPPAVYAVGALGVVAVSVGTYFEVVGLSRRGDLTSSCQPTRTCAQSQVDAARNLTLGGDVTIGAGLLLLATAAYLYVAHLGADPPLRTDRSNRAIGLTPAGSVMGLRWHW